VTTFEAVEQVRAAFADLVAAVRQTPEVVWLTSTLRRVVTWGR